MASIRYRIVVPEWNVPITNTGVIAFMPDERKRLGMSIATVSFPATVGVITLCLAGDGLASLYGTCQAVSQEPHSTYQ
jgi:hypothetical protein